MIVRIKGSNDTLNKNILEVIKEVRSILYFIWLLLLFSILDEDSATTHV